MHAAAAVAVAKGKKKEKAKTTAKERKMAKQAVARRDEAKENGQTSSLCSTNNDQTGRVDEQGQREGVRESECVRERESRSRSRS